MSLSIPKISSTMRKIDLSSLTKVDMRGLQKTDMSKICSVYPNPAVKKVNFLEARNFLYYLIHIHFLLHLGLNYLLLPKF